MNNNYFTADLYLKIKQLGSFKNSKMLFPIHKNCHPKFKLTDILFAYNNMTFQQRLSTLQEKGNKPAALIPYKHHHTWKNPPKVKMKCLHIRRPTTVSSVTTSQLESPCNLSCSSIKLKSRIANSKQRQRFSSIAPKDFDKANPKTYIIDGATRKIYVCLRPKSCKASKCNETIN